MKSPKVLNSWRKTYFKESLRCFDEYAIIYYQSNSVVDFNIPDDDMIYGIGILLYRMRDSKVFEIFSDEEEQIMKILNTN